jgi:hypothetical protein
MGHAITASSREQRRDWRYACTGNVTLYDLITKKWVPGRILDLSISGCLVVPDEPGLLRAGDVVEVSFSIQGFSVRAPATIRHVRGDSSMGIQFRSRGNDESNRQISRLMQKLAEESMRDRLPGLHG